jgi:hypothetical protein
MLYVLAAVLAVAVVPLKASDQCGVYALVEKVVLEPNETEPTAVQIWGAFALSDGKPGDNYLPPQRGYFYYTCPKGKDSTCLSEWGDLRSVAAKQQLIGFGGRWIPNGRLRTAAEKPATPDVYPIQMGVIKVGEYYTLAVAKLLPQLREALKK